MYALYNMLDVKTPVYALQAERMDFNQELKEKTSLLTEKGNFPMVEWMPTYIKVFLQKAWSRRGKDKYQVHQASYLLNNHEIERIKKEYQNQSGKQAKFISTNDITTSWLFTKNPKANNVMMAVNLRPRLDVLKNSPAQGNLAENYVAIQLLKKQDLQTPEAVRLSVNQCLNQKGHMKIPSEAETKQYLHGIHTNWVSFYKSIQISQSLKMISCEPVIDLIFLNLPLGFRMPMDEVLISYKCNDQDTVLWIASCAGALNEKMLDQDPMTGKKLHYLYL